MQNIKIGCVIMASGLSARFGSNKLLQEFCGRTLIERILDTTAEPLFDKRIVVTRTKELTEICQREHVDMIFHEFPGRNDAVRLGVEYLKDMDAILFCPCDQPLLSRRSIENMVRYAKESTGTDQSILRLSFCQRVGAPVLFGKNYFEELCHLPEKRGGSYLAEMYVGRVVSVPAEREIELEDADTPETLRSLAKRGKLL